MQQILKQTERTEPATDQPTDQSTNQNKKSGDIICKFEIPASDYGLKRADRTGTERTGTGITVQSGNAEIFQFPFINFSLYKSSQISVSQQSPKDLDSVTEPLTVFLFFSQFQYTPDRYYLLFAEPYSFHRARFPAK